MSRYKEHGLSLETIQSYFSHLNPIAQRIARDIRDTKLTYSQLWYKLNQNEQNDIINETLIKPEISLKYFRSFPTSSSSNLDHDTSPMYIDSSKTNSTDSLTKVVLQNINNHLSHPVAKNEQKKQEKKRQEQSNKSEAKSIENYLSNMKSYYAFDGWNLRTFALQKVALKVIQDETLGTYRDEHSSPFSYRTKSQMNLQLFGKEDKINCIINVGVFETHDDEIVPLRSKIINNACKKTISTYKALQNELKVNLKNHSENSKKIKGDTREANVLKYERLKNDNETEKLTSKIFSKSTKNVKTGFYQKNFENGTQQNILKSLNDSNAMSTPSIASYADTYIRYEESVNLMQNCNISGALTASSSSCSDRDYTFDDIDEKTLSEDIKLLDNDVSLRKGFDFLNNW